MERPRLLLVPEFTELEWAIRPQLEAWAEVASYDPPGVGDEPIADEDIAAVSRGERPIRELFVRRGLEEVDRRGWDRFFIVADGWANATAARIAHQRPAAVLGIGMGHACLSYDMDGDPPVVSREVWAAMRQLLSQDHREFIRHGIVQMTQGSVDDEAAELMLTRFPKREYVEVVWDALPREHEPIGEMLHEWGGPLLLAQHVGCISFSEEGFNDAVEAFPEARVLRTPDAPSTMAEFSEALREFCEAVLARRQAAEPSPDALEPRASERS
jgi:hypothetical protein